MKMIVYTSIVHVHVHVSDVCLHTYTQASDSGEGRICDATVRNNTRQDGGQEEDDSQHNRDSGGQEDDSQHNRDSGGQENDGTVEGGCGEDPPREDVGHGDDSQDKDGSSDDSNSERLREN